MRSILQVPWHVMVIRLAIAAVAIMLWNRGAHGGVVTAVFILGIVLDRAALRFGRA